LKVIVHSGRAVFNTIAGLPQVSGTDVILAHRLLKNSIPSHEYLLMTEAAYRDLGREMSGVFIKGEELCEGLGRVTTYVQLMSDSTQRERDRLYTLPPDAFKSRVRKYLRWGGPRVLLRAALEQFRRPVKPVGPLRRASFLASQFLLVPLVSLYYRFTVPRRMLSRQASRSGHLT